MSETKPPSLSEMEEHLKHYGVKGMRWGVRRTDSQLARTASKAGKKVSEEVSEKKREAISAGKVAFAVAKAGIVPAAAAVGVAAPVALGLGVTLRVLSDPSVQAAITYAKDYSKAVLDEIGLMEMSTIEKMKVGVRIKSYEGGWAATKLVNDVKGG